ncbi:DoxX family protein [Pseudolabrys sp. Root1462]|jgi:putative oxidoreductase|uniref:DoxX family protein n=1 Tax=Pseudolabrys sp. Root1462 TaxID=1736466 RepID=UPI0009E8C98F|nr:DoxX family protein [Pseudolabrys sp. Root1462]
MLARTPADTRLLIPGLAGFYAWAPEVGYLLLRVVIGYILFMHGWAKVQAGFGAEVGFFVKVGFAMPVLCAFAVIFLETVAAACVALGLFTRFFAAALAVEIGVMFVAIHGPKGFSASKGGYEYVLLLGMVMFFIALAGGRRYSLDRMIGKEL